MNGYDWDGTRWVPRAAGAPPGQAGASPGQAGASPGQGWAPPSAANARASGAPFPPLAAGGAFTEARYGYGLTRQTSDDIQFIARYLKIAIILGLVLLGIALVVQLITVLGLIGLVGAMGHG